MPRTGRQVALTIDDGPASYYTPRILDVLDRYGVVATFCMVGRNVSAYPDLARMVALAFGCSSAHGLDRVGCGPKLMRSDVGHRRGLTGSIRGVAGRACQLPSSRVGGACSLTRLRHRDLAAHPCPSLRDRLARPRV